MPENDTLRADFLRVGLTARPVKVDRAANAIRGMVVAQLGVFKDARGEFTLESLGLIEKLGNDASQGLRSRFSHPTECNGGSLGNYLGRARDFFLSETVNGAGETVAAVRADLYLDETALKDSPNGGTPRGIYVMNLAESDAGAISSSLHLRSKKVKRKNPDGTMMLDANGDPVPAIWLPEKLLATDIVDDGAAVDGLLGVDVDGLQESHLWKGTELLDELFEGLSRDEVKQRLMPWVDRYLNHRFGEAEVVEPEPVLYDADLFLRRQKLRELEAAS